jgi:hypothetical protein
VGFDCSQQTASAKVAAQVTHKRQFASKLTCPFYDTDSMLDG